MAENELPQANKTKDRNEVEVEALARPERATAFQIEVDKEYAEALQSIEAIEAVWKTMSQKQQALLKAMLQLDQFTRTAGGESPGVTPPAQAKLVQYAAHGVGLAINAGLLAVGIQMDLGVISAAALPIVQGVAGIVATQINNRTKT